MEKNYTDKNAGFDTIPLKMNLKTLIFTTPLVVLSATAALAAANWEEDFEKGLAAAKADNRVVFLEFTGSDWCPPCKQLKAKILNTAEFEKFAADNKLVLIEQDYPRTPEKLNALSDEVKEKRENVRKRYGVSSFPTVLLTDGDGAPFASVMGARSVEEYMKKLTTALEVKKTLDADVSAAMKLTGVERADALAAALKKLPANVQGYQIELIKKIIAADPSDKYGFAAKEREVKMGQEQMAKLEAFRNKQKIANQMTPEDFRNMIAEAQEMLKDPSWLPQSRLQLNKLISDMYAVNRDYENTLKYLKAAHDSDPGSKKAQAMQEWIVNLEKHIANLKKKEEEKAARQKGFDSEFAAACQLTDKAACAAALDAAMKKLPPVEQLEQKEALKKLAEVDPDDKYGYIKKEREVRIAREQQMEINGIFKDLVKDQTPEAVVAKRAKLVELLKDSRWNAESRLQLNTLIGMTYNAVQDWENALKYMKIAYDCNPNSHSANRLRPEIAQLEKLIAAEKQKAKK